MNIEEMAKAHDEYENKEKDLEKNREWIKRYGGHERV